MKRTLSPALAATATLLLLLSPATAHGPFPQQIPVARLLANLSADLKAKPKEQGSILYYRGRAHYYAFFNQVDSVSSQDQHHLFEGFGGTPQHLRKYTEPKKPIDEKERLSHLRNAVLDLYAACDAPTNARWPGPGMAELCLACVLEDGAPFAEKVGRLASGPEPTTNFWLAEAEKLYKLAYEKARDADANQKGSGGVLGFASYEASQSYERLLRTHATPDAAQTALLAEMAAHRQKLEKLPRWITPLVFSLTDDLPLDALLAPEKTVLFDLRGFGKAERFGWVKPDTAFLVWDPERTGKITSGRQLFGSATWWMFFPDAYAALNALDDNHDGWLSGKELEGLSLWLDRNQNGKSDPGEVVPLSQTPIAALATRATGKTGSSPMSQGGLKLKSGRRLNTYDWTLVQ